MIIVYFLVTWGRFWTLHKYYVIMFYTCDKQSGRELTAKGIRALEYVGKETLDILAAETGFEIEKDVKNPEEEEVEDGENFTEDVTFDHCFYIYGGTRAARGQHLLLCCGYADVRSPFPVLR